MAAEPAAYPFTVQDAQTASHTFYIHPNESPSTVLVSPPLSEGNYHNWARAMKMSLLTKNKLGFVDGSIAEPPQDHPVSPFWQRCNMLVLSWLIKSMSVEIAQSILWRDKATDVWKELRERFSQADLFRISELQEEIFSLKQGDSFVSKFYTSMKTLWDELDILNPLPVCTCNPRCSCGAIKNIEEERNKNQVVRFLKGLNDQFSGVRSQLMLLDTLPNVNRVFALIAQQERQFSAENISGSKAMMASRESSHDNRGGASTSHSGSSQSQSNSGYHSSQSSSGGYHSNSGGNRYSSKKCSYCGKMGHTVDDCYKKHGFPPGFKFKNPKYANKSANCVHIADDDQDSEGGSSGQDTRFGFTADQYHHLLALLPTSESKSSSSQHTAV
ncbi:uncharacterized protein LOC130744854 [Lotus japonicus]|uniref:uncharacterized protein LOC130744852 n=1 Tax=Lotus japonicus TaxID=34305 RepID=UPI00258D4FA4|nr:uncharacterized protein LOC130744852 [Lotus japonicus]XP_057452999.1 uncharacterized protein LOC130744854 [Lotus japonicus]